MVSKFAEDQPKIDWKVKCEDDGMRLQRNIDQLNKQA